MQPILPETLLLQLSEFVAGEMGLLFSGERLRDLERGIRHAAHSAGEQDTASYVKWLLSAPLTKAQVEILASELTVGETYFFRENRAFDILRDEILPQLIRARQGAQQQLRIWSAGCCTGEEPYSIAILLDRVLPLRSQWNVTILATDINPRFLRKAAEGIYSEWSFRNPSPWLKEGYFQPLSGHRHQIIPRIRERVTFEYLNLAEDAYPSLSNNTNAMDVIFCRNVLMYFSLERAGRVVRNFRHSLVEGGWLIVSPTEVSMEMLRGYSPVTFEGAILHRKLAGYAAQPLAVATPIVEAPKPPAEIALPAEAIEPLLKQANEAIAPEIPAMDANPPKSPAGEMASQARECANTGNLAEALTWAEKAIAADKLDAGLYYLRATILQEQGAHEESALALKRAIYLEPDFALAHFALGNLALHHNRRKEADRHFSNTLGILARLEPEAILPESEGLAAGRLRQIVESTLSLEGAV